MRYLILAVLFLGYVPLQGQQQKQKQHKKEKHARRDSAKKTMLLELKEYRIELINKELGLDKTTSAKFFAVYNPYFKETSKIRKTFRKKWRGKSKSDLSESEATEYLKDVLALRKKEIELLEKVSKDLKGIIPMTKIIQLPELEKKVKRKLLKKAKELRQKNRESRQKRDN